VTSLELLDEVDHQASMLGNLVRTLELISDAWSDRTDPELRLHLRRLFRWAVQRLEPHHAPELLWRRLGLSDSLSAIWREELASRSTDMAAESDRGAVGEVIVPLLDAEASQEAFLIELVVQEAADGGMPAGAGPAFVEAIRRAEQAVFGQLLERGQFRPSTALLSRHRFSLKGARAARSYAPDGGSVGAGAAVALYSLWTDRPLPLGVVVTGGLGPRGEIQPVEGLAAKVRCVVRERPLLQRIIVPESGGLDDGDERIVCVASLDQLLERVFGDGAETGALAPPAVAVDVEGTVRLGVELYEKVGSFSAARQVLGNALTAIEERRAATKDPTLFRVEEFIGLWRQGSCLVHQGDPFGARSLLSRARALGDQLWEAGELDPRDHFGSRGNLAVLHRDLFEYGAAERLLLETLEQQRALRQDKRQIAKTLGNLGELWTFTGELERAERALSEALAALRSVYPDEVPRELCYLGNLYLRRCDPAQARACFEEGLAANQQVTYGRERNEAFLRYGLARAHLAAGRPESGVRQADRTLSWLEPTQVHPRQLILKVRGLAWLALAREVEGRADLLQAADLTFVDGPLARLGVSTALAALALHLTEQRDHLEATRTARRFVARVGPLLDPMGRAGGEPDLQARLEQILDGEPGAEATKLAHLLGFVLEQFPY
jgi:tetratricopeptide (TPR) repeat protein